MVEIIHSRSLSEERKSPRSSDKILMPSYPKLPAKTAQQKEDTVSPDESKEQSEVVADQNSDSNWVDVEEKTTQKYFRDDSVLLENSEAMYNRRRRRDAVPAVEVKVPKGMDKTHVIYV